MMVRSSNNSTFQSNYWQDEGIMEFQHRAQSPLDACLRR